MLGMAGTIIFAVLLQGAAGPRNLQVAEDAKLKPILIVPTGTSIPIALITRISTKNAKDGDGVYARTLFPITVNNEIVIPTGSNLRGKITQVDRAGRVKGKASLTLSFQTLILPSGLTVPIYASLGGASGAGDREGENTVKGDSSKGKDAGTIATTAAEGTGIGAIGAGSGSRVKGAGIGAAGGAAVGLASVLLTRGQDLVLEPGSTLEIVLDRPLEP